MEDSYLLSDLEQVRVSIESVRALLPLVQEELGPEAETIREAISQLQMMYARAAGSAGAAAEGEPPGAGAGEEQPPPPPAEEPPQPGEPGPAQRSGRLWVPGQ